MGDDLPALAAANKQLQAHNQQGLQGKHSYILQLEIHIEAAQAQREPEGLAGRHDRCNPVWHRSEEAAIGVPLFREGKAARFSAFLLGLFLQKGTTTR